MEYSREAEKQKLVEQIKEYTRKESSLLHTLNSTKAASLRGDMEARGTLGSIRIEYDNVKRNLDRLTAELHTKYRAIKPSSLQNF